MKRPCIHVKSAHKKTFFNQDSFLYKSTLLNSLKGQ
jgi:hypothetical protein